MKKLLFATILCLSSFFSFSQCTYELCISDDFGDGWNGNTVDVFVNGALYGNYGATLTNSGPLCFLINVNDGDVIDVIFNATGAFTFECNFVLNDASGNQAGIGDDISNINGVVVACPCGITAMSVNPQAVINCGGGVDTLNFSAGGFCNGNYEFQVLDGATVVQAWSTASTFLASPPVSTTYTVEARCLTNCPGTILSDTFRVDIIPAPTLTGNITLCAGDSTTLTATGSTGDFEWWDSETGGLLLDTTNVLNTGPLTDTTTFWSQASGATSTVGKILITECGLEGFAGQGSADYLEISNLFATPVNTTGWVAAISADYNNINNVNPILWNMPNSFNACSVVSRNDVAGMANYWGNNIMWNPGANTTFRSWAIIIDDVGNVVDFVAWGWQAADIAAFNTNINGFNITLGPEWTGNGCDATCGVAGGPPLSIQRVGNSDGNTAADFVCQATTVDVVNPSLSCGWTPVSCRFPMTVNVSPEPTVTVPANATYCAGDNVPASVFTSNPAGATYAWTNSDPTIGLAANGTGNTPAFVATNTTGGPITATITVTPSIGGCIGQPVDYTITVDPTPVVTVPANANYCDGDNVPASVYTSNPAGATFAWTNSDPTIGLAANATGNAPAFVATNATAAPITATISVTPTLNGCVGLPVDYTITVDPTPVVTVPANATYCAGDNVPAGVFTSNPAGATFTWTNSDPTIGLAANGTGNTPAFVATNATGGPITATISVTPTLNGCVGLPVDYTITVNPIPAAPTALDATICPNNSTILIASAPGGTYEWYDAAVGGTLLFTGGIFTTPVLAVNTNYWVQTTLNGCTSPRTMVTVTVAAALLVDAGVDDTICSGDTYFLNATPNGIGYTYVWDEPGNLGFSNLSNPGVSPLTTTTYTVTVTDPTNCVGTDMVTITVNPVPTANAVINEVYCHGDPVPASVFTSNPIGSTFIWNNSDTTIGLPASGNGNTPAFIATNNTAGPIVSALNVTPILNGCVGATINYTITVNPIPVAPTAQGLSMCPNNSTTLTATAPGGTYEWYDVAVGGTLLFTGASYTTPVLTVNTDYWVQTTLNGCTSPRTLVSITIAPSLIVDAGADDTICDGTLYNLGVTPNGAGYTFAWDEPGNLGFSNLPNPNVSPTTTTTYTVTVTDATNCVGTDMITITVDPIPTVTVPANATYCDGDPVPASAFTSNPTGATFSWSNSDPTIGLAANGTGGAPAFTATNTSSGTVSATISVTPTLNGCVGNSTNYTITVNPIPVVTSVPSNNLYCNGSVVPSGTFLSNPIGASFSWTNSDPTIGLAGNGTGSAPAFTAVNNDTVSITATISVTPTLNGCSGSPEDYTITISSPITIDNSISDISCFGYDDGVIALTPSGGTPNYSYLWTAPGVGNSATATDLPGGPVTVTVTDANNCSQDSTFNIIEPAEINYISFDGINLSGCSPLSVELFHTVIDTNLISALSWNLGNDIGGVNDSITNTFTFPGSYDVSLTLYDTNGCYNTLTIPNYITVHRNPVADFTSSPAQPTMLDPTVDFTDLSNSTVPINFWSWNFGGLDSSFVQNPSYVFPSDTGIYDITLYIVDMNGCTDIITQPVRIFSESAVFIPNAFTPDGNGLNDMFMPKGFGVSERDYSFYIFDRWGELIFETHNLFDGWDGTYKGKLVPNGTFVWKIIYNDLDGGKHKEVGRVSVAR